MAGEVSPFALLSAFASASPPHSDEPSPGSARGSSSLSRVSSRTVGFHEPPAVALEPSPKPSACSLADRQHSMGSLGQLLRAAQAEPTPPRPRLSIQTCRSLKAPARGRRVLRIAEDEEGPGGSTSDLLGTTAPSHAAPAGLGMHRSSSIDIGPSRLSKAKTAPEALPDSLVLAAITTGYLEPPAHHARPAASSPPGASLAMTATFTLPSRHGQLAAEADGTGGGTLPSRHGQLHMTPDQRPQQPQQHSPGVYHRTGSSSSTGGGSDSSGTAAGGSGRPPMPVTPAAMASSRSGSLLQAGGAGRSLLTPPQPPQQQQPQQGGRQLQGKKQGGQRSPLGVSRQGSFRELFDAQAEAAMAQATMTGLHEALRRREDEIQRLQQELARVAAERDELREAASSACTAAAATQHISVFAAAASGAVLPGAPAGGGPAAAAAAGGLQPLGGALLQLHSAGRVVRGVHRSAQAQQPAPPAAPPPPEQQPGECMVSAFAGAIPFSFE